jgi:hypothetical protein
VSAVIIPAKAGEALIAKQSDKDTKSEEKSGSYAANKEEKKEEDR